MYDKQVASTTAKELQIPYTFCEVEKTLISLDQLTSELRSRLEPVLTQEPTNPATPPGKGSIEPEARTVYDRLRQLNRREQEIVNTIQDILRLLEI